MNSNWDSNERFLQKHLVTTLAFETFAGNVSWIAIWQCHFYSEEISAKMLDSVRSAILAIKILRLSIVQKLFAFLLNLAEYLSLSIPENALIIKCFSDSTLNTRWKLPMLFKIFDESRLPFSHWFLIFIPIKCTSLIHCGVKYTPKKVIGMKNLRVALSMAAAKLQVEVKMTQYCRSICCDPQTNNNNAEEEGH